jgi:hypothetical protein
MSGAPSAAGRGPQQHYDNGSYVKCGSSPLAPTALSRRGERPASDGRWSRPCLLVSGALLSDKALLPAGIGAREMSFGAPSRLRQGILGNR